MADTERIVCYDRPNDNNALLGALMSRNNNSLADLATLSGGGLNNNIWLVLLLAFMGRGFGGYGYDGAGMASAVGENYNSRQISSLQDSVNNNHNNDLAIDAIKGNGTAIAQLATNLNCDFNTLQTACCGVKAAVDQVGGLVGMTGEKVINAVNLGDANLLASVKDCCCQTQQNILKMSYENQLATERQTNALGSQMASNFSALQLQNCKDNGAVIGRIDQLANGMTQGFAQIGYQMAQDKAEMIAVDNANTQRILDKLCADRTLDLSQSNQDLKNRINTMEIIERMKSNGCGGCGC